MQGWGPTYPEGLLIGAWLEDRVSGTVWGVWEIIIKLTRSYIHGNFPLMTEFYVTEKGYKFLTLKLPGGGGGKWPPP